MLSTAQIVDYLLSKNIFPEANSEEIARMIDNQLAKSQIKATCAGWGVMKYGKRGWFGKAGIACSFDNTTNGTKRCTVSDPTRCRRVAINTCCSHGGSGVCESHSKQCGRQEEEV